MGYCSVADVKRRLGIAEGDQSYDEELSELVEEASCIIDSLVSSYVETPLNPVPELLRHACANIAAGLFRRRRAPPDEKSVLFQLGLDEVDIFLRSLKSGEVSGV